MLLWFNISHITLAVLFFAVSGFAAVQLNSPYSFFIPSRIFVLHIPLSSSFSFPIRFNIPPTEETKKNSRAERCVLLLFWILFPLLVVYTFSAIVTFDRGAAIFPFFPPLPVGTGNAANIAPNLLWREYKKRVKEQMVKTSWRRKLQKRNRFEPGRRNRWKDKNVYPWGIN